MGGGVGKGMDGGSGEEGKGAVVGFVGVEGWAWGCNGTEDYLGGFRCVLMMIMIMMSADGDAKKCFLMI